MCARASDLCVYRLCIIFSRSCNTEAEMEDWIKALQSCCVQTTEKDSGCSTHSRDAQLFGKVSNGQPTKKEFLTLLQLLTPVPAGVSGSTHELLRYR